MQVVDLDLMDKEDCRKVANGLEVVKRYGEQYSFLGEALTDYMHTHRGSLNLLALEALAMRFLVSQGEDTKKQEHPIQMTPDVLLTSDFLSEKITPWVRLVREELFGSPDAPFANLTDVETWFREQGKLEPPGLEKDREFISAISRAERMAYDRKIPFTWHLDFRAITYIGADGKYHNVQITQRPPGHWRFTEERKYYQNYTKLNWLENETRIMARATGFTQFSLTSFVLMGVAPILPRYELRCQTVYQALPSGEQLQPTHISLTIRSRDLTFEELRKIYNGWREALQLKKHKLKEGRNMASSHWEIYQLVKKKGGPPKKKGGPPKKRGIGAFWKSVKEEWNSLHPEHPYHTWKGIQLAYARVISKLEYRITGEGD